MKKRLGDILLARGVVDSMQLQSALAFQRQWGQPLGQVVVAQGFAGAAQVLSALEEQTGLVSINLDAQQLDSRLARLIPLKVAESHRVVPLRLEGARESVLVVAIAAPASLAALDAVKSVSGKVRVVAQLATDAAISRAISRLYRVETLVPWESEPEPEPESMLALPDAEEVMHFMDNCLLEDVVIEHELFEDAPVEPTPRFEQDGLPLLSPLEFAPPQQTARVLVYGWSAPASAGLVRVLGEAGVAARAVDAAEVQAAGGEAVIVSPLPSVEALGGRLTARLLVAGKAPEREFKRSQAVGALGFLQAPVDPELLVRAVRRLLRLGSEPYLRVS